MDDHQGRKMQYYLTVVEVDLFGQEFSLKTFDHNDDIKLDAQIFVV
jgi:hypothetical protein